MLLCYNLYRSIYRVLLCLVLCSGSPPFEAATGDYTYYIFAYNERNQSVRYIYSYSEVGGQPYYLSLEW